MDQGERLRGVHLDLSGVQIGDSGLYNCDLNTYPHGSMRVANKLEIRGIVHRCLWSIFGKMETFHKNAIISVLQNHGPSDVCDATLFFLCQDLP